MIKNLLLLFKIELSSFLNRFKNNFATGLTVFLCSSLIFSLFIYIFYDFTETHLKEVGTEASSNFRTFLGILLIFSGSLLGANKVRNFLYSKSTSLSFSKKQGEHPQTLFFFKFFYTPFLALGTSLPFFALTQTLFSSDTFFHSQWFFLLLTLLALIFAYFIPQKKQMKSLGKITRKNIQHKTQKEALIKWRIKSLFFKNNKTKALLLLSLLLIFLMGTGFYLSLHKLFLVLLCFFSSFFAGVALLLQIKDDFKNLWLEKSAGISHTSYMNSIFQVSNILGLCLLLCFFLSFFSGALLSQTNFNLEFALLIGQLSMITITPLTLTNSLALQIDPKRAEINSLLLFLSSLFICTSFLIHLSFSFLLPVVLFYGNKSQEGRFYTI